MRISKGKPVFGRKDTADFRTLWVQENIMNKERMLRKIGYGAITAFVLVAALVVSCAAKANTQPPTATEALPIICTTPEEAEKALGNAFDTMLLSGRSSVTGFGTALLFNRISGHYVFVILTGDNRVCFVDMGRGESKVLQKYI